MTLAQFTRDIHAALEARLGEDWSPTFAEFKRAINPSSINGKPLPWYDTLNRRQKALVCDALTLVRAEQLWQAKK